MKSNNSSFSRGSGGKMEYATIRNENLLPFLLGLAMFIYLVLRVWIVPISDDEYITVDLHASMSWWSILITGQPQAEWAPNNHVLNTLFMKLEILLFGRKDWAVRLHVLAAFVFCFYYTTKIIQQITPSRIRQFLYLLILFFNPYLLDFFGLARGYALSIAGFTAAFYYFLLYTESLSLRHLRYTFIALFIAIWSNFSALYMLALMGVFFCYEFYINKKRIQVRTHLVNVILSCLLIMIVIIVPLIRTLASEQKFGGKTGVYQDMIVNYVNQWVHQNPYLSRHAIFSPGWRYIEVAAIIIFSLWLILQMVSFLFKTNSRLAKMHLYSLGLVLGVVAIAKILFVLYATPFPTARTELLFSVPFYLATCIAFERIIYVRKWAVIFVWLIIAGLCWHFKYSVTFENTIEWWQNGDAKRVVAFMKEEIRTTKPDKELRMGVEGWQYHSLAFYTEVEFKDELKIYWTDLGALDHYDYLFVPFHLSEKVPPEYEPVKKFVHGTVYKLKSQ